MRETLINSAADNACKEAFPEGVIHSAIGSAAPGRAAASRAQERRAFLIAAFRCVHSSAVRIQELPRYSSILR